MTNQLIKNTNITYIPGTAGVAAYPGQPGYAAYTSYEQQLVCAYVVTGGTWQWTQVTNSNGSTSYQYLLAPNGTQASGGFSVATSSYQCNYQSVPVYHPAQQYIAPIAGVAPTASQTTFDYNLGWNAGARSQGFFIGDGYASFMASPSIVGVVAGFNYTDPDANYTNIDYGFYISNGIVRLMELGSTVAYIGPQVPGDTYKLSRRLGVVSYYINDVSVYTSVTPSTGVTFLDVSFYSGGDYLDSPAIAAYGSSDMVMAAPSMNAGAANRGTATLVMEPMTIASSPATPANASAALQMQPISMTGGNEGAGLLGSTTVVSMVMEPMTVDSRQFQGGILNMLPLVVEASDYITGDCSMSFAPMTLDSVSGSLAPSYALANLPMVQMTMSGQSATGSTTASLKQQVTINADGSVTVTVYGPPGSTAQVTFPDGSTASIGTGIDGTGSVTSGAGQAEGDTTVATTSSGGLQTTMTTTNGDGSITAGGTGAPGATVTVTFPDGSTATTTVGADGTYSIDSSAGQLAGTTTVVVSLMGHLLMQPMTMLAGRAGYGTSNMTMVAPAMYASAYEGNQNASMRELVLAVQTMSYYGYVDVSLFSSATMTSDMYVLVLKDAAVMSSATVDAPMTYSAIMQALMQTSVQAFAGVPILTDSGEVWVVNDESGASSRYENFAFNSFGKYKGHYFGVRSDGVYLLEGDKDVAANIRASISLGQQDFGTTLAKGLSDCYIGLSASGDVYLKVITNGQTYLYKTVTNTSYMDTQRIPVGRGLRGTHITFELFNETGADFEISSIEFQAVVLSRRI